MIADTVDIEDVGNLCVDGTWWAKSQQSTSNLFCARMSRRKVAIKVRNLFQYVTTCMEKNVKIRKKCISNRMEKWVNARAHFLCNSFLILFMFNKYGFSLLTGLSFLDFRLLWMY